MPVRSAILSHSIAFHNSEGMPILYLTITDFAE